MLATVFIVLGLLGTGSWATVTILDYQETLERAARDVRQAAALLNGHARSVLERSTGLLVRIADRMDGRGLQSWTDRSLDEAMLVERFGRLTLFDAGGAVRFGPAVGFDGGNDPRGQFRSGPPEPPSAGRPFPAPSASGAGLQAAEKRSIQVLSGHMSGQPSLLLLRRIHTAAGALDGTVLAAVPMSELTPFLDVFDSEHGRTVGLYGPDGLRLAGSGPSSLGVVPTLAEGEERTIAGWGGTGASAVLALVRMQGIPLLAAVSVPQSDALASWHVRLERGILAMLVGVATLAGLALLGMRGLRREAAVRRALTDANARLEQRVADRTAALSAANVKLSRALEEKERANQAKGRFLSAANHDLRQPFQALRLFHHILMERLSESRDRSIAEKMGEALDAGEKLLHALLEVATLDAGVVRPQLADVPVAPVLDDLLAEFRSSAAEKGLVLTAVPCRMVIRTDRTLLNRMLGDLVRNAIRFTESGRIMLGCRRRGQWLRIEVWDTGPGIPAEQLDNIFEDFVQLGNPERDRRHGLGLGLAKVRRKAALLGHAVEVRSRPGRGSVFAVHVPVVGIEGPVPAAPAASAPAPVGGRLILVVEDDPVQRDALRLLLESWGHSVMEAVDGENALAVVGSRDRREPDMVVSDFRLPGRLTGVQTVGQVGELLGRAVPGLILTGDTAPERIRDAVATGCRLLHKPVTPDDLRDAITAILSEPSTGVADEKACETQQVA
ncbi:hybrid sensor histidine kinase/response regulator [Azospirillum picis]|uniref:histidine kinase n=1 Tax=Azospirillum picis TaxID=488438 RepID=A0ABU0MGS7_9PROT|nr:ATP-binding protein [Azospirillum picis]MBP2299097.1 signal transduction histidine kinase/ActR/RegA family two-component response regulator [Azospirillum picis]MDQ0532661.1 signal transduction histidine kinase/ActR/RegA family two-component response regulator [Azospirillum picis]